MQKAGVLMNRYYIEQNEELQNNVIYMVKTDGICQWLLGDALKQDQFRFLYNVNKVIYESAIKDYYLNAKTN